MLWVSVHIARDQGVEFQGKETLVSCGQAIDSVAMTERCKVLF